MSESVSLEQRRSKKAWSDACLGVEAGRDGYVRLVREAPVLIMDGGLMQALAYFHSCGEGPGKVLLEQLCAWISRRPGLGGKEFQAVMDGLAARRRTDYMEDSAEVLAYLRWLRHFAAAVEERG